MSDKTSRDIQTDKFIAWHHEQERNGGLESAGKTHHDELTMCFAMAVTVLEELGLNKLLILLHYQAVAGLMLATIHMGYEKGKREALASLVLDGEVEGST